MTDPIIKEITVPAPPKRAFEVFTAEIGKWWPLDTHSLSSSDGKKAQDVRLEPQLGGAIIETLHDGRTANWGRITVWEPGSEVAFTWHLRRPEGEQTLVSVEFTPERDGTRVRLVHSGWDAQGAAADANRNQYDGGWDHVLGKCYAGCFAG